MGLHLMFVKVSASIGGEAETRSNSLFKPTEAKVVHMGKGKVNHNSHACWDRETPLSMKCAGDLTSICLRNAALAVEVPSAIPGEVYHAGRDLASPSAKDCGHSF